MSKKIIFIVLAAIFSTILFGTIYVTSQQVIRQYANDPQIQLSEDLAGRISDGTKPADLISNDKITIGKDQGTYIVLYDANKQPVSGNGYLDGSLPNIPSGVFDAAKLKGEHIVTWQPKKGIRQAIVVTAIRNGNGFIVAGRSLRETEERTQKITYLVLFGWIASIVVIGITGYFVTKKRTSLPETGTLIMNK